MFAHLVKATAHDETCPCCVQEVHALLDTHSLITRFRPVADFNHCDMAGYIASVRGPVGMLLGAYERLTQISSAIGRLHHFTCDAFATVLTQFLEYECRGLIFVPIPKNAIETLGMPLAKELIRIAQASGITLDRVVLIVPDIRADAYNKVAQWLGYVRSQGLCIAARTLLCHSAEQQLWSEIKVDFTLLDEEMLDSIDLSATNPLQLLLPAEIQRGRQLLATGIANKKELHALMQLGVRYGASHFIGSPNAVPTRALSAAAHKAITVGNHETGSARIKPSRVLERLLIKSPPVTPMTFAGDVFDMFEDNPDLRAVAVVEHGKPLGLISRYEMIDVMARSFRKEIFGHKPCQRFMDDEPLMVDIGTPLEEVAHLVVGADPRHLISGFVVTESGAYLGIGWVQDLLREVTSMQMESARYANPLTQLPGNVPINQHIDQLLASGQEHCVVYCDLDNFKPFNDVYGYAKGDEVIKLTARVLTEACDPHIDYVGHIGGDDFILICRSADWHQRCQTVLNHFAIEIACFFSNDDLERGGYVTENRKGMPEFHPLISLSLGAVEVKAGMFANHLEVAKVAAEVKKKSKSMPGNSLYVNHRHA